MANAKTWKLTGAGIATALTVILAFLALVPPYYDSFMKNEIVSPGSPIDLTALEKRISDLEDRAKVGSRKEVTDLITGLKGDFAFTPRDRNLPTIGAPFPFSHRGLTVCNYGYRSNRIALASTEKKSSRGWWDIPARQCTLIAGTSSTSPSHYSFAESPAIIVTLQNQSTMKTFSQVTQDFCVDDKNFDFKGCNLSSGRKLAFWPFPFAKFAEAILLIGDIRAISDIENALPFGANKN